MNKSEFVKLYPRFEQHYKKLNELARLVEDKSKVVNITAIRDYDSIWHKHILDSLEVTKIPIVCDLLSKGGKNVLDIGTGAGFPGLPLAIVYPNLACILMDSTNKKVEVVKAFVSKLGLSNVNAIWGRAEGLSNDPEYKRKFDVITARAVGYLPALLKMLHPFKSDSGLICAYKNNDENELREGIKVAEDFELRLKNKHVYQNGDRVILAFK